MGATLLPLGILQFCDAGGNPLVGGSVGFYEVGSPGVTKTIWGNAAQTTLLTNPIPLDAAGRPFSGGAEQQIFGLGSYLMIVRDFNGVSQWTATTTSPVTTDDTGNVIIPSELIVTGIANVNDLTVSGTFTTSSPVNVSTFGGPVTMSNPTAALDVAGTANINALNVATTLTANNPAMTSTIANLAVPGTTDLSTVNVSSTITFGPGGGIAPSGGLGGTVNVAGNLLAQAIILQNQVPGGGTGAALETSGVVGGSSTPWTAPVSVLASNAYQGTGYFTTSDERIKRDIKDIGPGEALRWVMAARPRRWWYASGLPGAGYVAQEEIERGRGDSIRFQPDEGDQFAAGTYAGYQLTKDYNYDLAFMTAVLQQLVLKCEALEDRLAMLEAGPNEQGD